MGQFWSLREKRALTEHVAQLEAELVKEKVIPMQRATSSYQSTAGDDPDGLVRLDKLGTPSAPAEPLEVSDVPKKALAGRVVQEYMAHDGGYRQWAVKQYFVLNPAEHGIPEYEHSRPVRELTPEERAEEAVRQERVAAEREARAALEAAEKVRHEWLRQLMQRKTLPEDALAFVAKVTIMNAIGSDMGVFEYLGVATSENATEDELDHLLVSFVDAAPKVNPVKLLLASVLADAERDMSASWHVQETAVWYLPVLAAWGYGLSDAEQGLLADDQDDAA